MKKTTCFISLAIAALFISCSSTTDDASISLSVPREIISSVFKSSDGSESLSDYPIKKIKCTLLDKNEKEIDSQTDDIAENTNTVITFSGIPAGTKVSASATIYGSDNENSPEYSLYTGQSGKITVKPGNNTITLKLKKTTTTVVLYNNTLPPTEDIPAGTPASLSYATLTSSGISGTTDLITKASLTTIIDYCFDKSNNLYAIVYDGSNDMTPYSIKKYPYNNGYDLVTTYTSSEQATTFDYIEASSDGRLYAVITSNTGTQSIVELTLTDPAEGIKYQQYFLPTAWTSGTSSCNILTFCTDGTNFYVIAYLVTGSDTTNTAEVKLASCTVSDYQLTENEKASIILDSITNQNRNTGNVFSDYSERLEYRDLCYINGKLYLLVRDVVTEGYNNTSYSRGALCTFTVKDNGEIASDKIGIGYQNTPSTFYYHGLNSNNSYENITISAYIGDGQSTFYGPVKFVARKQDELIIADDGFSMISEASKDYPDKTQATVSSKNAVVTYNLNKESLNFVSLDGEYFEEKYSGYFYDSGFNETNQ
ncbi:MAG: hypothetical protein PUD29_02540 [Treponema porcinum]|uniref:hypothetical protein n=1 Tax=Treponema porcinum TaxID=261392 RepID=UPI0024090AEC|nr:hypothetical protein [Treponema porcinum]MDD6898877.1 hypothetical protein [Treponema porcinum]